MLVGTVVARGCANLGVTVRLSADQARRAAELLPAGVALGPRPALLIETSTCEAVTIDGVPIGPASLSEAALSIRAPARVTGTRLRERYVEHLFMLSQLDSNPELSAFKAAAGYRTEVVPISLERHGRALRRRHRARASAGGRLAPASASAGLTPPLLPPGVAVPNPGIVFKLWTRDEAGRLVVTTNVNSGISRPALGRGQVAVAADTPLARLLGGVRATGVAFSGAAEQFVNDTYVVGAAG